MKRQIVLAGLLILMALPAVAGEEKSTDLTLAVIQAERKALVEAVVQPAPNQEKAFWETYWEYRGHVNKLNEQVVAVIEEYVESYASLSDQQAARILKDATEIDAKRAQLKQKYVKKFQDILVPKQVVRWYQIENKMDAVINFEMAVEIPIDR